MNDEVKFKDTEYPIRGVDGKVVAIHVRRGFLNADGTPQLSNTTGKQQKTYFWKNHAGRSPSDIPLFRSEYLAANKDGYVILTEGIAATEALRSKGFNAVGTVTGAASSHSEEVLKSLEGQKVYLWSDNDEVGREHMDKHAAKLHAIGVETHIVQWQDAPFKGADAADLIASKNGTATSVIQELLKLSETPTANELQDVSSTEQIENLSLFEIYSQEAKIIDAAQKMGIPRWVDTGFVSLNNIIGGGLHPGVIVIHAEPGVGKSAFVLQLAINSQIPTLLISTEMSMQEMVRRAVSQISGKPRRTLLNGSVPIEDELASAQRYLATVPTLHIHEAVIHPATNDWIDRQLAKLKSESVDGRSMLIIDSWHSWVAGLIADDPNANEHQALNMGYTLARKLSIKYNIPVVMVAERNKQSMSKVAADNTGNAIAGTRKATYGPDLVLSMDFENKEEEVIPGQQRSVIMRTNKNRNGPPNVKLHFMFNGENMTFSES